ncbi:MAG: DUF4293 domain-containing protein [Bacteroidales bacterium]|jgi:hypothetical protein|nr:DUF4293 domain-containing protein [Bacteroidales bacterium]
MIQRIQTLYLILTTILSVLFLNGHIIKYAEGSENILSIGSGVIRIMNNTGGYETVWILVLLASLVILIFLISVISIFFYRKRKIQIKMAATIIILVCLLILASAYYYISVAREYNGGIKPGINVIILPVMLLFSYLTFRGIRKDEELVKSYDRLR